MCFGSRRKFRVASTGNKTLLAKVLTPKTISKLQRIAFSFVAHKTEK